MPFDRAYVLTVLGTKFGKGMRVAPRLIGCIELPFLPSRPT